MVEIEEEDGRWVVRGLSIKIGDADNELCMVAPLGSFSNTIVFVAYQKNKKRYGTVWVLLRYGYVDIRKSKMAWYGHDCIHSKIYTFTFWSMHHR